MVYEQNKNSEDPSNSNNENNQERDEHCKVLPAGKEDTLENTAAVDAQNKKNCPDRLSGVTPQGSQFSGAQEDSPAGGQLSQDSQHPHVPQPSHTLEAEALRSEKSQIRTLLLNARSALPAATRDTYDARIGKHAAQLCTAMGARTVAAYWPVGEPGGTHLIAALQGVADCVLVPRCLPGHRMEWGSSTTMQPGKFGIPEPAVAQFHLTDVDLIITPAVAVSTTGVRLGRGGGFYDRAFANTAVTKIPKFALVYSNEVVPTLPAEPFDCLVHGFVSEQGITRL